MPSDDDETLCENSRLRVNNANFGNSVLIQRPVNGLNGHPILLSNADVNPSWITWMQLEFQAQPSPTPSPSPSSSPSPSASVTPSQYNFNQHIAPIIQAKCIQCHRDGGVKETIQFNTFEKARNWAALISSDVVSRRMPPWGPAEGPSEYGVPFPAFKDARKLSSSEIAMISDWAAKGTPEGPAPRVTASPSPSDSLSGSDVITLMPPAPFTPNPGTGKTDQYRCFMVGELSMTQDLFVTAFEVVPDKVREVHHALLYKPIADSDQAAAESLEQTDPATGYDCSTGAGVNVNAEPLAIWAPGTGVTRYPMNTGLKVARARKLILQIHYNTADYPAGALADRSAIRVRTAATGIQEAHWYGPGKNSGTLALNQANALVTDTQTMQTWTGGGISIFGIYPHMHQLGTRVRSEFQRAGAALAPLFDIPQWNFNWQGAYFFPDASPITLQAADSLRISCHYDTTLVNGKDRAGNNRTSPIPFGENTTDEMCFGFVYGVPIPSVAFDARILAVTGYSNSQTITSRLTVASQHVGVQGSVFIATLFNGKAYYLSATGQWIEVAAGADFPAYRTGTLPASLDATLASNADLRELIGAKIYMGYGAGATVRAAQDEMTATARYKEIHTITLSEAPVAFDAQAINVTGPITNRSYSGRLTVATADRGKAGNIYVAAAFGGKLYFLTAPGQWQEATTATYAVFQSGTLPSTLDIMIQPAADLSAFVGAKVSIGYGVGSLNTAQQEMLNAARYKQIYEVAP